MKLVNYKNIVSFKLPKDWIENYNDDEATFYQDSDDSGTLRLKVITSDSPEYNDGSISLCSDSDLYVEEGFPLTEEIKYITEDDENFISYYWYVCINKELAPCVLRFTYTINIAQENTPYAMSELSLVRNTIICAHYLGEKI